MRSQQVKGCCPLDCQDSCAWIAHVAEGRVTRVTGARGLIDGDQVVAQNNLGSLATALRITDKVRPGVVVLDDRWSCHSDTTPAAVNLLTPAAWTPAGQPAYNDIFVDVLSAPHSA